MNRRERGLGGTLGTMIGSRNGWIHVLDEIFVCGRIENRRFFGDQCRFNEEILCWIVDRADLLKIIEGKTFDLVEGFDSLILFVLIV